MSFTLSAERKRINRMVAALKEVLLEVAKSPKMQDKFGENFGGAPVVLLTVAIYERGTVASVLDHFAHLTPEDKAQLGHIWQTGAEAPAQQYMDRAEYLSRINLGIDPPQPAGDADPNFPEENLR